MKAVQRGVYLELARTPIPWPEWGKDGLPAMGKPYQSCLCVLCKLARWEGHGPCDDTGYYRCRLNIPAINDASDWGGLGAEPGHDCWGFRPLFSVDTVAEFVGRRLRGEFVELPLSLGVRLLAG